MIGITGNRGSNDVDAWLSRVKLLYGVGAYAGKALNGVALPWEYGVALPIPGNDVALPAGGNGVALPISGGGGWCDMTGFLCSSHACGLCTACGMCLSSVSYRFFI